MEKFFISGSKIEYLPNNENGLYIYTRHQLMELGESWRFKERRDPHKMLSLTRITLDAILEIPGVVDIAVYPHQIFIGKAEAFSWEELEPKIALAMSKYLPAIYS